MSDLLPLLYLAVSIVYAVLNMFLLLADIWLIMKQIEMLNPYKKKEKKYIYINKYKFNN